MEISERLREMFEKVEGVAEYTFNRGDKVAFSAEEMEMIYLIVEGEIDINYVAENGNTMHLLIAGRGQLVGAVDLPLGSWLVNMTARTKVKLLGVSMEALSNLEDSAVFWKAMYLDVSRKFREFGERTFTRSTAVSYETFFLLYLKERGYELEFNSLADLAYCLNLEYRNFFRVVKKLTERGVIVKERNRIFVPDVTLFQNYLQERF